MNNMSNNCIASSNLQTNTIGINSTITNQTFEILTYQQAIDLGYSIPIQSINSYLVNNIPKIDTSIDPYVSRHVTVNPVRFFLYNIRKSGRLSIYEH